MSRRVTIVMLVLAALGTLFTFLQWAEQSQWLPRWLSFASRTPLDAMFNVVILALLIIGFRQLRQIGRRPPASIEPPNRGGLHIVSKSTDGAASVILSEREFDLGPGALEYFERQSGDNREKLLRLLRRQYLKRRFTREDFIVEVDETQRWHIRLDEYIGKGRRLAESIEAELGRRRLEAALPPPNLGDVLSGRFPSLAAGIISSLPDFKLQQLGADVQGWQDEVYEFLRRERAGFAEEFQRPLEPPKEEVEPLAILLKKVKDLIERLVHIKGA